MMITLLFAMLFLFNTYAQEEGDTFIQLGADTTTMQTGEQYTIRLEVINVQEFWSAEVHIAYDPQKIYVLGTQAGSPFSVDGLMSDGGAAIYNTVDDTSGILHVGLSMFSPADPITGSGAIARIDIVPLNPGTTELRFTEAELISIQFDTDAGGQRIGTNPTSIEFLPILLNLTIEGEPATPPPEATATPTPTETANPDLQFGEFTPEVEATLINITAVPATATIEAPVDNVEQSGNLIKPLLIVSGLIVIIVIGISLLFFVAKTRQK